jgi:hypothetical protein
MAIAQISTNERKKKIERNLLMRLDIQLGLTYYARGKLWL